MRRRGTGCASAGSTWGPGDRLRRNVWRCDNNAAGRTRLGDRACFESKPPRCCCGGWQAGWLATAFAAAACAADRLSADVHQHLRSCMLPHMLLRGAPSCPASCHAASVPTLALHSSAPAVGRAGATQQQGGRCHWLPPAAGTHTPLQARRPRPSDTLRWPTSSSCKRCCLSSR